jgi:hypothetical protein
MRLESSTSSDEDPSVTFSSAGDKGVTLTVTDDDGATNSITQTVTVAQAPAPAPGSLGLRDQPPRLVESGDRLDPEIELLGADRNALSIEGSRSALASPMHAVR